MIEVYSDESIEITAKDNKGYEVMMMTLILTNEDYCLLEENNFLFLQQVRKYFYSQLPPEEYTITKIEWLSRDNYHNNRVTSWTLYKA